MSKINVIGVAAQLQNGKDTLADYLQKKLNDHQMDWAWPGWGRSAFAHSVKKVFCDMFEVDFDFIEKWKTIPECPPGFTMPVRQSLQFIGDGFRKIVPTIWIDLAFKNICGRFDQAIISDVRYINELERIKVEGGVNILVWRKGKENDDPNGSEAQLRPIVDFFAKRFEETGQDGAVKILPEEEAPNGAELIDIFIANNGSIEDLYHKVDKIVVPYIEKHFTGKGEQNG